jgi:hypothetical protein
MEASSLAIVLRRPADVPHPALYHSNLFPSWIASVLSKSNLIADRTNISVLRGKKEATLFQE